MEYAKICRGIARNTAYIQQWLDGCSAVLWYRVDDDHKITFEYNQNIEVAQIPVGVWFQADQASEGMEC